jgi:hypothetical protein
VQKITGLISIFTIAIKPSPNGFKATPVAGETNPSSPPAQMLSKTQKYK